MTRTGKFATREQIDTIKGSMNTPLIVLQAGMPRSPQQVAHDFALQSGLPEIPGYYGIDLKTGEFLVS